MRGQESFHKAIASLSSYFSLFNSTFAPMEKAQPSSFLMVCLGNICRSPLAEGILQEKARAAGLDWKVDSAGTTNYHIGEAPHHLSQKVARINGVDISRQQARRFNADDFQRFDKIYAMAGDVLDQIRRIAGHQYDVSKVGLLLNELHPGGDEDVPDPWYGPEPGYHEVYKLIDAAADKIIKKYGQTVPGPNISSTDEANSNV
jgi:protein-tyrosine phosphatase